MNKTENSEILRLRKELAHQHNLVTDLQEELEEKNNLYMKIVSERDTFREKLSNATNSVNRVEQIVQSKVNLALEKERQELARLRQENQLLLQRIEIFDQEKLSTHQREKTMQDKIVALTQDLQFYARNVDMKECMNKIDQMRVEHDAKKQEVTKLLLEINKKSNELESALAENRTLRKMANVPQNYGIDAEQIKFLDREKIDDYKKLIRVLQEDNYRLEEERAKLKHMLKQQSMLYKTDQPQMRYKNLTSEQLFKVDQYVLKLMAGDTEEPADFYKLKKENQILKAQLDILNSKGFDLAKVQVEAFLKELGLGESGKFMEKIMSGNEELKKMLRDLLANGLNLSGGAGFPTQSGNPYGDLGKFRPPIPTVGIDGEITQGYSYKFQTHLDVLDKDGRAGLSDQTKYDVAFLQLQLVEFVEIIKRKDEDLSHKNNEIEGLYKKVRDYLLVQDQLYKDFIRQEKDYNQKKTEIKQKLSSTRDSLYEEQHKVKILESALQEVQKGDKQSIEHRLIELTKQNSILDINLLRLTRKYQILSEQEEILRRQYENKEADQAEKDTHVQQRINMLKEWKTRAIQQLKFLFNKLRLAVPITEYQSVSSENEILKQKNADYIDRNCKLAERLSKLQTQLRENMEAEEKIKTLQDIKEDLESEYEVVRKRLENVDPSFKWENAVFNKIVATLKRYSVSPQQAFEAFDSNKDGKLTRQEFMQGLEMLKVADLSMQELDALMGSIDIDSDGYIQYREFVRKLSRHGVKSRSSEEQIIYLFVDSLRKTGVTSMEKAFRLIDKEDRGILSREDFKDIFKNIKMRIDESDVDKFIDNFWKDKKAGIDYQEFLRIFSRYQVRLDEEGSRSTKAHDRIPDEVLRKKKFIFQKIDEALTKEGKTLKDLFKTIDKDQSYQIDIQEFKQMFERMRVELTNKEIVDFFNSIDFDQSGKISFPEFIADFNKTLQKDITTLINEEKERVEFEKTGGVGGQQYQHMMTGGFGTGLGATGASAGSAYRQQPQQMQQQTRIAILETREKNLSKKLQDQRSVLTHAQQSLIEVQQLYDNLDKRYNELTDQNIIFKQEIRRLEEVLRQSIKKEEAMLLKEQNEHLRTEIVETKAAMITYKNMTEVISDQVRGLKLAMERKKDENENLINAVREISSQSEDQKRLGKLYYLVMLSRWQEAAVNKKYDMVLTENRELRKDLINAEQRTQMKEYEHHDAENAIQLQNVEIEHLKEKIANSNNIFLTIEKAEELNGIIKEISDEKTDLEEAFFVMRTKYRTSQLTMDEALVRAENAEDLLDKLKRSNQSEIHDRMIELSNKLQGVRLQEMRATRECTELKEKNTYLSRLLRQGNDQVRKLEEKAADYESKVHKREEEFRRQDNERMKRFFAARFDDIPGAFDNNPLSRRQGSILRDSERFKSPSASSKGLGTGRPLDTKIDQALYEEPDYIKRQNSINNQINTSDQKFIESKVKKLEVELQNALEKIRAQDAIINRFKEWQLADKYLAEDEVLKDAIERQRSKANQVHEQDSKEMAEAAAQMVKTLQEMLDQKNIQLRSKEETIDQLRQHMLKQREQDALVIAELNKKLSITANTTLSKLQQIVINNENKVNIDSRPSKYDNLTREELNRRISELDSAVHQQDSEIKALHKQIDTLKEKNLNYSDMINELQYQLEKEKKQKELKDKMQEIEKLKKEIAKKDVANEKLAKVVQEVRDEIMVLKGKEFDVKQDIQMQKISESTNLKELKEEISKLKSKLKMVESSRDLKSEELKKVNVQLQEQKDGQQKLILERDELLKSNKAARERLDAEIRKREKLEIEINSQKRQVENYGSSVGPTYPQLLAQIKELQLDIKVLECQTKTVVAYNKEVGTFEYIGEPVLLSYEKEVTDIDEMLGTIKAWIKRNNRLTFQQIFESQDRENFGEINEAKFDDALLRLGLKLRSSEKRVLKECLDQRNIGFLKYMPLVRELQDVPQHEFIIKEILRLAKLVELRDLDIHDFKSLIDPQHLETMNLTQLQQSIKLVNNEQFNMSDAEVEFMFKNVTKSLKTIGVNISINKLTDKVFTALDAIIIEKTKEAVLRSQKTLRELLDRHDANKDQSLQYAEFENMLLECQLVFKPKTLQRLYNIMDPGRRTNKITFATIKFYVQGASQALPGRSVDHKLDVKPSLERAKMSENIDKQQEDIARAAARKILPSLDETNTVLGNKDTHNEGIVSTEIIRHVLREEMKNSGLTPSETEVIIQKLDNQNRGFVSLHKTMEKIQELASESRSEVSLRNFAISIKRQSLNLRQELARFDTTRTGRIDKKVFSKALNQLGVPATDEQLEDLFQEGEDPDYRGVLDIKRFVDKIADALKLKVGPLSKPKAAAGIQSKLKTGLGANTEAFENWEAEKKYKKKLEALQQQIEESKKDAKDAEKLAKHWQDVAAKQEKEKVQLQGRLVDANAKPPKAAANESNHQAQVETMQQLKDQLFSLQEENLKLERIISVDLKSEIKKLTKENDHLSDRLKHFQDEAKRQESQVQRLIGMPARDKIDQREEGELWRELKIQQLEKEIEERELKERDLADQLLQAETKLLELRFQKETFDLQYGRLQKRITDLEQYKLASSKFSAVIKNQEEDEIRDIDDKSNAMAALTGAQSQSKKNQDTVKLRSKSSKSVGELEMLVESLKRVIEKQKVENEQLRRQMDQYEKHQDKLKSEKQLRQKIESLEQEVHSYEMKDVHVDEKDRTIKKLIEANRQLREDMKRETERYQLIESKYKDLLVKYNVLAKENARNAEMLFNFNTGSNIKNYDNFLERQSIDEQKREETHQQRSSSKGFGKSKANEYSYEKNFEDVF